MVAYCDRTVRNALSWDLTSSGAFFAFFSRAFTLPVSSVICPVRNSCDSLGIEGVEGGGGRG